MFTIYDTAVLNTNCQTHTMHLSCMLVTCLSVAATHADGDVFTSIQEMENLYRLEDRLLKTLESAINFHQSKVDFLTQRYTQLVSERPTPHSSKDHYLGHPVDCFVLIRRLVRDWPLILNFAEENFIIPEYLVKEVQSTGEQEMESAVRGLARLQYVYSLDTEQLADGRVREVKGRSALTAADCMEIVQWFLQRHEFMWTIKWLETALRKVVQEEDRTVSWESVISYMHVVNTLADCDNPDFIPLSHPLLQQLVTQSPSFTLDKGTAAMYRLALTHSCSWYNSTLKMQRMDMHEEYHEMYNRMCSGQGKVPNGLHCHLVHYDKPALRLAPFKLEEIHVSPPLVMVHQVISDSEIKEIQDTFPRVMINCEVLQEGQSVASTYRMCKRGWMDDYDTPASRRVSQRIGRMANLSLIYSEPNQVGSYGLGGEYKLHYDNIDEMDLDKNHHGHRLATVMLYLNDVTLGGYTVFPYLDVAVVPVKGAAVMWYNTLYDSTKDTRMLHGGCPVLLGSKWVINKWIHEGGQYFQTQCPSNKKYPKDYFYL